MGRVNGHRRNNRKMNQEELSLLLDANFAIFKREQKIGY